MLLKNINLMFNKITFLLFVLFFSFSECEEIYFVNLKINETLELSSFLSYIYFIPEAYNEFIQIKIKNINFNNLEIYSRYYDTDNITYMKNNLPTIHEKNDTKYSMNSNHEHIIINYSKNLNIKLICFRLITDDLNTNTNIEVKRGRLFEIMENKELELSNVFLNVYYIDRIKLKKSNDYLAFYSKNISFSYIETTSDLYSFTKYENNLFIITPSEYNNQLNNEIINEAFIIIEDKDEIHLSIKLFEHEKYKIFSWKETPISFDLVKKDCDKTIIGIEYNENNRNAGIDYLKAYGDVNMFISYDIGKSLTIDELIDSSKTNIFDNVITNKDTNFYTFNCTMDSFLTINYIYSSTEINIDSLPGKVIFIEKGITKKITLKIHIEDEYNIVIYIKNVDNIHAGDVFIKSESQSFSLNNKKINLLHKAGENYFQIMNLKYDIIFNITLEIDMKFEHIYKEPFSDSILPNKDILIQPETIISFPGYNKLYHSTYANGNSNIFGIYIRKDFLRHYITNSGSNEVSLNLDNDIIINHNKLYPKEPLYIYYYFGTSSNNFSIDYYYTGLIDLQQGKIFHANNSKIKENKFYITPIEENINMMSFQIFSCQEELTSLNITLDKEYSFRIYSHESYTHLLDYNSTNVKGEGNFEGEVIIYYNLYSCLDKCNQIKDNKYNFKLSNSSYNAFEKKLILQLYPFIINDTVKYEIYYSKNGTSLSNLTKCEAFQLLENYNKSNNNQNIKYLEIENFSKDNTSFMIDIDYSQDEWEDPLIMYDIMIFAKQVNYQKRIDIIFGDANLLVKYDIDLEKPIEVSLEPNSELVFLYDENREFGRESYYYIYFDQNIQLDEINFMCASTLKDSREDYPNLNKNYCTIIREPDSLNSFILYRPSQYYFSPYATITIKKKIKFTNKINFTFIKKNYINNNFVSGINNITVKNYFPIIYNVYTSSFFQLFRRINESLNIFYLNENFKNININSKFNKRKSLIINDEKEYVTIIIPLKNYKIDDKLYFEIYYTFNICNKYSSLSLINQEYIYLDSLSETISQLNYYGSDIYKKKVIHLKNIYYENEKVKYYIINEDNIEKDKSIRTQCFSNQDRYLLNEKYIKSNNDYDYIYTLEPRISIDILEFYFEVNNYYLELRKEYRFYIPKNNSSKFFFPKNEGNFKIEIKKFSKSNIIIYIENSTYSMLEEQKKIKIEYQNEESMIIENKDLNEDSYILILLYPLEKDIIQLIEWNSNQVLKKKEYGLVKLDKNYNVLSILSYKASSIYSNYLFIEYDSEKKFIPDIKFLKAFDSPSFYLKNINYNNLVSDENYYLLFNLSSTKEETLIQIIVYDEMYNLDNNIIKTKENNLQLFKFTTTTPITLQIIPCENSSVNLTIFNNIIRYENNISQNSFYSIKSDYINIYGKCYLMSTNSINFNENYTSSINITNFNTTHIKIYFLSIDSSHSYGYRIIQFNSNSNLFKDKCLAYDIINQSDYNEYKSLYYIESSNKSFEIFLNKKNLTKEYYYFNIIGINLKDFLIFYEPVFFEYNYDKEDNPNGGNNLLWLILGIIIILILIILMAAFFLYKKYKENNLINNVNNMKSIETELV